MKKFVRLPLFCLVALLQQPIGAIIIRHDSTSANYQVQEADFPAVFYLALQDRRKICAATLITPRWAITAAHCLDQTPLTQVLQGDELYPVTLGGTVRHIRSAIVHPDYQPGAVNEVDLALLEFAQVVNFPRPIALYNEREELGQIVSLVGWGFYGLGSTGRLYDDGELRRAENRISVAARRLEMVFDDPRESGSTALPLEGMPGLGDSGGPALLMQGDTPLLMGVAVGEVMEADFSEETQGRYGSTAIYERISLHRDWITMVTGELTDNATDRILNSHVDAEKPLD